MSIKLNNKTHLNHSNTNLNYSLLDLAMNDLEKVILSLSKKTEIFISSILDVKDKNLYDRYDSLTDFLSTIENSTKILFSNLNLANVKLVMQDDQTEILFLLSRDYSDPGFETRYLNSLMTKLKDHCSKFQGKVEGDLDSIKITFKNRVGHV